MIEFNLNFNGYIDGRLHSFVCSRTFDTLAHPLRKGISLLLVGRVNDDEVSLVVTSLNMTQNAEKLTTSIEWELDSYEGEPVDEAKVKKIQRVLEFNGWSCKAKAR